MMVPSAMASHIIAIINQSNNAVDANNKFYKALCSYVEANAQVFYSWTAALPSPPYTPDPMVVIEAKIKTFGTLTPSGATDCSSALAAFSAALNSNASLWQIIFPVGFALSPAFVIPTINITPSMATDQMSAMVAVCTQIINGLKLATPAAAGTHIAYTGAATFTSLI